MQIGKDTLYIKADQNVEVQTQDVTLGDVVSMECVSADVVSKLKTLKLLKVPNGKTYRCVISVLKIIEKIHEEYPNLEIQNMGTADIIVTYEASKKENPFMHWGKVIAVVLITFLGAAFSIMTFSNDVDTPKLFSQIYEQVMGVPKEGYTIMEVMYSIGVTVGILVFFNHFGNKKFSVDPTPMEVEMRLYENDIQTTLIENYSRKGQELDVDKTSTSGSH